MREALADRKRLGGLGGEILEERVEVVAFGHHRDTRISDEVLGSGQLQKGCCVTQNGTSVSVTQSSLP